MSTKGEKLYRALSELDAELVEEARRPKRTGRRLWRAVLPVAACLCLLLIGAGFRQWLHSGRDLPAEEQVQLDASAGVLEEGPGAEQLVSPVSESTAEELSQLVGVAVTVPSGAENVSYQRISLGDSELAQAQFLFHETEYTYRIQRTQQAEDISGLYYDWDHTEQRTVGTTESTLQYNEAGAGCLNWYADGCSFSLGVSAGAGDVLLLTTAGGIMRTLGYDMAVDDPNAVYSVIEMGEDYYFDMGETIFSEDGVVYRYRTVGAAQMENISGLPDGGWQTEQQAELGWCQATLRFNAGGEGYIYWYDVAPGLLYSLSMDSGASAEALLQKAQQLYTPMQGEVG